MSIASLKSSFAEAAAGRISAAAIRLRYTPGEKAQLLDFDIVQPDGTIKTETSPEIPHGADLNLAAREMALKLAEAAGAPANPR